MHDIEIFVFYFSRSFLRIGKLTGLPDLQISRFWVFSSREFRKKTMYNNKARIIEAL